MRGSRPCGVLLDTRLDESGRAQARSLHGYRALRIRTARRRSQNRQWPELPHAVRVARAVEHRRNGHLHPRRLSARERDARAGHRVEWCAGTAAESRAGRIDAGAAGAEAAEEAGEETGNGEEAREETGDRERPRSDDRRAGATASALARPAACAVRTRSQLTVSFAPRMPSAAQMLERHHCWTL